MPFARASLSSSLPDPKLAGTVIVGMSGGVDSAVAALLLQRAGFAVQGLFMSNWEDDDDAYCTSAGDFQDARRVCDALQLPLHKVSFAAQYRERVFELFLREYAAGRTPNPDVLCNREIKFGVCLDYMHRLGASWIATGHYARLQHTSEGARLLKAADTAKDQSYFLHAVAASALRKTLFPIGELHKPEVRRLAREAGLSVYDKPDSTGICFIGERPFQEFLSRHLHTTPGPIENDRGQVIGEHRGLALHTLGQRSGLGIGGRAGSAAAPWYVADKDLARNALIVVQDQDHPLLLSDSFDVEQLHWLNCDDRTVDEGRTIECAVKTRYRQNDLDCTVHRAAAPRAPAAPTAPTAPIAPTALTEATQVTAVTAATSLTSLTAVTSATGTTGPTSTTTTSTNNTNSPNSPNSRTSPGGEPIWRVNLDRPARAVTPGQYAVFYQGDLCLGGGVIARRFHSRTPNVGRGITYNSEFSVEGS